jgi:prophage DNA circulation protein
MTDAEDEVLDIVRRIGPVVLSAAPRLAGDIGSALRRAVGMMVADRNMTDHDTLCLAFQVCIDLARHCGATLAMMDRVRKAALAEAPEGLDATLAVNSMVRLTLAMEARIVAYMSFASREEVDTIATAINAVFGQASEYAADNSDVATYMAIVRLHGDVTQHLAERGRVLPRVINYRFQIAMPSLRMAQRSYADPTRHAELIAENAVVHPAFMPREGKMLAT